jgi:hypothetical protein
VALDPDSDDLGVPDRLRERVKDELTGKEKLYWIGQPDVTLAGKRARMTSLGLGCGALITLIMTIMFFFMAGLMGIFPLLFFLVFTTIAVMAPMCLKNKARHTVYALTSRRCLVFEGSLFGEKTHAPTVYTPGELTNLRRQDAWWVKGCGDVIFKTIITITTRTDNRGRSSTSRSEKHYGFIGIRDPERVERMIREALVDPLLDKLNQDDD